MGAFFPIADVLSLASGAFVGKCRRDICETLHLGSDSQGEDFARQCVAALSHDAFVRSEVMPWNPPQRVDIYAFYAEGIGWWLKIWIFKSKLSINLHQLTDTIRRDNGTVIHKVQPEK